MYVESCLELVKYNHHLVTFDLARLVQTFVITNGCLNTNFYGVSKWNYGAVKSKFWKKKFLQPAKLNSIRLFVAP